MNITERINRVVGEDSRLALGASATSATAGITSIIMAPILVSALISGLDLSEKTAGLIASAEFLTIACAAFLIAPKMGV